MMGTLVSFTIVGMPKSAAEEAIHAAADEMQRVEDVFTIYGTVDNEIKRFNHAPLGQRVRLSDEINVVLHTAMRIQNQSHGAFNPALGALNQLWGFSKTPPPKHPPDQAIIEEKRQDLSHCLHEDQQGWWRDSAQCQLDFGGIAKGYAIDRGIHLLKKHGVEHALIDAGGDLRVMGQHGEHAWRIGIRHPRDAKKLLGVLHLKGDVSVVTSGDYERFFIDKGQRYHHILDPQTGYSSQRSQSVTVVGKRAMLTDAWSTAVFVLGKDAMKIVHKKPFQVLWVGKKGEREQSDGWHMLVQ
ncbi:MAG: FAD:protein FMN transferase [Mariprofundaceae bacterium]|nr:FAD:protein FMN transferase [Mariprofundaceae bacterium]